MRRKHHSLPAALLLLMLVTIVAEAQTQALNPSFDVSEGLRLDSPQIKLVWGSAMPDSTQYAHYRVRRIFPGSMIVSEWDWVKVFGIPIDSIFFHYVIPPKSPREWQGMYSVYLFFDPGYLNRMITIYDSCFGPAKKIRRRGKRFVYIWYTKKFTAYISNRKHFGALYEHVNAYIGISH